MSLKYFYSLFSAKLFQKETLHKNRQNGVSNFRIRKVYGCLLDWELCEDI